MAHPARSAPRKAQTITPAFYIPSDTVRDFAVWLRAWSAPPWISVVSTLLVWQQLRERKLDAELCLGTDTPSLVIATKRYGWLRASVVTLPPAPGESREQLVPVADLRAPAHDTDLVVVTLATHADTHPGFAAGVLGWAMPHEGERNAWAVARKGRRPLPVTGLFAWSELFVYCSRTFART